LDHACTNRGVIIIGEKYDKKTEQPTIVFLAPSKTGTFEKNKSLYKVLLMEERHRNAKQPPGMYKILKIMG